jgi:uncharacterized membrane protein
MIVFKIAASVFIAAFVANSFAVYGVIPRSFTMLVPVAVFFAWVIYLAVRSGVAHGGRRA